MLRQLSVLMGALALFVMQPAQAAVQVGDMAPDFEGVDILSGEAVKLSDLKGKTVVLEWTNHQCPYVRKHYDSGNMQKTQEAAESDYDVAWITVVSSAEGKQGNVSAEEGAKIVKDEKAHPTAKILDPSGEIGKAYDAKTTPHMFVIGADGTLVYKGAIDSDSSPRAEAIETSTNYVLAALQSLKEGKGVDPSSTAPYGCAVKY